MALSITTDIDLPAGPYPIAQNELDRLTRDLDGQTTTIHEAAWTRVLADLAIHSIVESDLNDPDQFKTPATYYCFFLLYDRTGRMSEKAASWYGQYERTMGKIKPDIGVAAVSPLGSMRVRISRA